MEETGKSNPHEGHSPVKSKTSQSSRSVTHRFVEEEKVEEE